MEQKLKIFILELKQDRKRLAIMCTLVAFGILLWARLLILQNVPKTGFADPGQDGESSTTPGAPGGAAGATASGNQAGASENKKVHLKELPVVVVDTTPTLVRDFFQPLSIATAQPEKTSQVPVLPPKSNDKASETPKVEVPDPLKEAEQDASKLRLESLMAGQSPLAVINGSVLRTGDEIEGFTIESIGRQSVTLRRGEIRVELKMKQ